MRYLPYITLLLTYCFLSCQQKDERPDNRAIPATAQSRLGNAGTYQLTRLIYSYYGLKDALVASNAGNADKAAQQLLQDAQNLEQTLAVDSLAEAAATSIYLDSLQVATQQLLWLKDETTEYKRLHFGKISDAVYALVTDAQLKNITIYRQYCPMAFNDKGAYWLSDEQEIRNPYFGKKMLECGEITDTIH